MSNLKGVIKKRYPDLSGKNWMSKITKEDRDAFMHLVRGAGQHGVKGGRARAENAERDERGRFK